MDHASRSGPDADVLEIVAQLRETLRRLVDDRRADPVDAQDLSRRALRLLESTIEPDDARASGGSWGCD